MSLVVGAGREFQTTPIELTVFVVNVPSMLVSTTVTKVLGLIARLPEVPAAISRLVLPPTHKNTELVCGTGTVGGEAAFGVPEVQAADRVLRQYSGVELDDSGRALPELQDEDFAAVLDD